MHSGGAPVADAPGDMSNAVQLHSCQTLTPETETTTHYFFQQSHRAGEGDERIVQSIYDSLVGAFKEDRGDDHGAGAEHRAQPRREDDATGDGFGVGPVSPLDRCGSWRRSRAPEAAQRFASARAAWVTSSGPL